MRAHLGDTARLARRIQSRLHVSATSYGCIIGRLLGRGLACDLLRRWHIGRDIDLVVVLGHLVERVRIQLHVLVVRVLILRMIEDHRGADVCR